jgi:6-phosphogluconolactonase
MMFWKRCFAALLLPALALAAVPLIAQSAGPWVYVGTYTGPKSKGIYVMRMDPSTGALTEPQLAAEVASPSFLTIHPNQKTLYAVSEVGGKTGGSVTAFSIAPADGKLTSLNHQPSGGDAPCFITIDSAGTTALVANYGSGTIEALPINSDGKLGDPSAPIQHKGKGSDPSRQEGPHAHSINLDAANKFAFAADLGLDKIFIYRFDPATSALTPNDPPFAQLAPGSGPRHFSFHPSGKYAYVINEMASTVTAFTYDAEKGALTEIQTITTLPADFKGKSYCAEVQVHPSGKFLYGSNRGHDSLAIYTIDDQTGKLTPTGHAKTGGKTPRNFRIDPAGKYLLAANQSSDSVIVFSIDESTGALKPTGSKVTIGAPVCIKFLPSK